MSVAKRTWKTEGKRKGQRKGQSFQAYVCHGSHRFRRSYSTAAEAKFASEVFLKMKDGSYRPQFYKNTVSDVITVFLAELREDYEKGRLPGQTFEGLEGVCLNYIIGDQTRYNIPGKRHILDRMLPWSKKKGLGHYKLVDVTTPVVTAFIKSFEKAGASYDLRSRVLSTLRRIFNFAMRTLGWVYTNPTDGVEVRKTKAEMTGKIEVPQRPHIQLLMRVANPLQALMLQFTCSTGLRVGEVMALQWGNIKWEDKQVAVTATINADNQRVAPKTEAGLREVSISDELLELLVELRDKLTEENGKVEPRDDDFVFSHEGNNFNHSKFYDKIVGPLFRSAVNYQAQYPDEYPPLPSKIRWTSFRHFALSMWLYAGLDEIMVITMAGHASFATIERTYGHIIRDPNKLENLHAIYGNLFRVRT